MLLPTVWLTACLASSTVMAVSYIDKPYYDLNDAENLFRDFVKEHGKEYDSIEYFKRLEIFKENLKDINRRNEMYPQTVFKVNYRADMKLEEVYKNHHIKYLYSKTSNETTKKVAIPDGPNSAPEAFDWRTLGKVTRVKDQGKDCCSDYIFSTIGNIESQFAIKHQQLLALSEGQILDCCYVNKGCSSGRPAHVMKELATRPGIMLEADYPYAPNRRYCHENNSNVAVGVVEGDRLYIENEEKLKQKLYDIGPLSVCFDDRDFRFYHEGIVEPDECSNSIVTCVLLVGYGKENDKPFWTFKNSLGQDWGEGGYGRLHRGIMACGMGEYTATAAVE